MKSLEIFSEGLLCRGGGLFAFRPVWVSVRSDEIARRIFIDRSDIVQYSVTLMHSWLRALAC